MALHKTMLHTSSGLRWPLLFILLLALGVRLLGIASRPIWYDEAFSILFSEKGPAAMMYGTLAPAGSGSAEEHPLEYYTLLWGWMHLFGQSLIAVRMLSVLTGMGIILAVHALARFLFQERTALLASLMVALAPFEVHYAQEIRMYALMGLWLALATYAFARARWVWFAIFAALAQYSHNLSAFYLIALALWPLFTREWKTLRAVFLAGLLAAALYLPWAIHLPSQFAKVAQAYWVSRPAPYRAFTLLLMYITGLPLPDSWLMAGLFIALSVTAVALWQTLGALHRRQTESRAALWMLYLSFTPPLLLFLASLRVPVYIERALLPSAAPFYIWLAWALFKTPLPSIARKILVGLLVIGAAMGIEQHITYRGFPYAPYRELDASLRERLAEGDVVVHSNKLSLLPALYYDRMLLQTYIADPPGSGTDTLAPATQRVLGLSSASDMDAAVADARRVWFLIFKRSIEEAETAGLATHPHLQYLQQHFEQNTKEDWGALEVYIFEKKGGASPPPRTGGD